MRCKPRTGLAALCIALLLGGLGNRCEPAPPESGPPPPSASAPIATVQGAGAEVQWTPVIECDAIQLTVAGQGGFAARETFVGGTAPRFVLADEQGDPLPDGLYYYELRARPPIDAATQAEFDAVADDPAARRLLYESGLLPRGPVQAGHFWVRDGAAALPDQAAEESG